MKTLLLSIRTASATLAIATALLCIAVTVLVSLGYEAYLGAWALLMLPLPFGPIFAALFGALAMEISRVIYDAEMAAEINRALDRK